ncbi:MAG: hypothetical protein ACK6D7_18050, partial [Acidobacteriota bacterium]
MDCQPHRTTGTARLCRQALAGALLLTIFAQSNAVAHQQAADAVRKLNIVIVELYGDVIIARNIVWCLSML